MTKNIETTDKSKWRFYRSNLSTVVWNPDKEDVLADFRQGHFTTDDPKVAAKLKSLGYPEISLDADSPPDIIVNQPTMEIRGDIPIVRPMEDERNVEKKMAFRMEEVGKPQVVEEEIVKEKPEPKNAKSKPEKKTSKSLPRRKKQSS